MSLGISKLRKVALPVSVRLFSISGLRGIPYALEVIGCSLQSKRGAGSVSEWQETTNARLFIRRQNPVIFDIGANMGRWTSAMLKRCDGNCTPQIVMFEPQSQCWPELEKIAGPQVTLTKSAVSNRDGVLTFFHGEKDETESASAYRSEHFKIANKIEVPCISLDTYILSNALDRIDFIKMDIEGHELEALKGAVQSLSSSIIRAISFEFGPATVDSRSYFLDYFELLSAHKYMLYRLGHDGVPIRIYRYERSLEYFDGVANYVAAIDLPIRYR